VLNFKLTDKTGSVAAVSGVKPTDEVMVVTNRGMMIRVKVQEISSQSRATQGVRVITVEEGESVVSVAPIVEGDDVAEAPAAQ